jgi:FtsH-binding integral membrane protein
MADIQRGGALRTIFSFFLGLMLTAFVGVGVHTFHPPPEQFDGQIRDLTRREEEIRNSRPPNELTTEDRAQIQEINRQRNELIDAAAEARKPWGRSTSVILTVFATLAMAVSLVRADQLPVISNGLMLGGVFTMLYGVGWIIATDTSITRFLVMTGAVVITLGLGYVRFVRRGTTPPATAGSPIREGEGFVDIERRIRDLEERMNEAAHALGDKRDSSNSS